MSYLASLRSSRLANVAVIQQFSLYLSAASETQFAFVEGADDQQYFQYEVSRRCRCVTRFLVCDGKGGVLSVLSKVEERYSHVKRTVFFVDKDFEDYLGTSTASERLFVTPFYSIENHIVGNAALHVVFCKYGNLESDDPIFNDLQERYARLARQFALRMRRYVARALACKRKSLVVNMNNVELKRVMRIDDALNLEIDVHIAPEIGRMSGVADDAVSRAEVKHELRTLSLAEFKTWLRGKAELWLFVKFIEVACRRLEGVQVMGGKRFTPGVHITQRNAVQLLADRVPYPTELLTFLDRTIAV